ncbi:MAG: hypothetical protein RIQ79_1846 [Verrucomicrobiota bacterium]
MTAAAARANILLLQQADELLIALGSERYASRVPACFNASPGGHLRHITDHYLGLLDGLTCGAVDYEHRARDLRVEREVGHAQTLVRSLIARLEEIEQADRDIALRVRAEATDEEGDREPGPLAWSDSSLLRELEFMLSHTVHHYALVAVMCRLLGHEPAAEFGMAPSTIRFLRRQTQSAASAA